MYSKIKISGTIISKTGMHIGGSSQFSAIGAVDLPIIKDVRTNYPMIPGSSLKGKLRTLLARQYNKDRLTEWNDDDERILRLFGSSKNEKYRTGRLIFSDMVMSNAKSLMDKDIDVVEVKFENNINRISAIATPRQIERSVRGGEYELDIIYSFYDDMEAKEVEEDFNTLNDGFSLLEYDYLGGNGSRGYGKVEFRDVDIECVAGEVKDKLLDSCRKILKR